MARSTTMPLRGHLLEAKRRLIIASAAVLAAAVAGWILGASLWELLSAPVEDTELEHLSELNFRTLTAGFDLRLQLAITVGIIGSSPVWLYQVVAFIAPGLKRRELKYVLSFTVAAVVLFLTGAATGWIIVPHFVQLLLSFVPESGAALLDARDYFDFVLKLMLATGVALVLPVILVLLNFIGVVSGRSLLGAWRWALVSIFAFTALATPSADVLAMFLLALPMIALYFAAIGIALLRDRRKRRVVDALITEEVGEDRVRPDI